MFQSYVSITKLSASQLTFLCFTNYLYCAKQTADRHTSDISNQYSFESQFNFWFHNHY